MGSAKLSRRRSIGVALAALACFAGCSDEPAPQGGDVVMRAALSGWQTDTVGVVDLLEGDTLNTETGLLAVETTRVFPPEANGGEVFAWEFNAQSMSPVKMLIVRPVHDEQSFEIIGESPLVVPRQLGANRFELPEPIPLTFPCLIAFYMPQEASVAFRKVRNWKTLITTAPMQRPFIDRSTFAMYGWRYGIRAFWRKRQATE